MLKRFLIFIGIIWSSFWFSLAVIFALESGNETYSIIGLIGICIFYGIYWVLEPRRTK